MLEQRFMKDNMDWGEGIKQSDRNAWGQTIEDKVNELAPYPISYDVDSTQPVNFTEFSYTEFLGGVYINSQSVEINTINIKNASKIKSKVNHIDKLRDKIEDKYTLEEICPNCDIEEVLFITGQNMFEMLNFDLINRIAFEKPKSVLKPHPLTDVEEINKIRGGFGWNRIARANMSGVELLHKCSTAYVTTATELCTSAVLLGKDIENISTFRDESIGIYYPINSLLFKTPKEERLDVLNNILDCKHSGLLFPWMDDIEERIEAFFKETIRLSEERIPSASPFRMKKNTEDKK